MLDTCGLTRVKCGRIHDNLLGKERTQLERPALRYRRRPLSRDEVGSRPNVPRQTTTLYPQLQRPTAVTENCPVLRVADWRLDENWKSGVAGYVPSLPHFPPGRFFHSRN